MTIPLSSHNAELWKHPWDMQDVVLAHLSQNPNEGSWLGCNQISVLTAETFPWSSLEAASTLGGCGHYCKARIKTHVSRGGKSPAICRRRSCLTSHASEDVVWLQLYKVLPSVQGVMTTTVHQEDTWETQETVEHGCPVLSLGRPCLLLARGQLGTTRSLSD